MPRNTWLPKVVPQAHRELQTGNGLLNTADSCQHSPEELNGSLIVTHKETTQRLIIHACCLTQGVLEAARIMQVKGVFRVKPGDGWAAWFNPCDITVDVIPRAHKPKRRT